MAYALSASAEALGVKAFEEGKSWIARGNRWLTYVNRLAHVEMDWSC